MWMFNPRSLAKHLEHELQRQNGAMAETNYIFAYPQAGIPIPKSEKKESQLLNFTRINSY